MYLFCKSSLRIRQIRMYLSWSFICCRISVFGYLEVWYFMAMFTLGALARLALMWTFFRSTHIWYLGTWSTRVWTQHYLVQGAKAPVLSHQVWTQPILEYETTLRNSLVVDTIPNTWAVSFNFPLSLITLLIFVNLLKSQGPRALEGISTRNSAPYAIVLLYVVNVLLG